jgi:hypothetical protein
VLGILISLVVVLYLIRIYIPKCNIITCSLLVGLPKRFAQKLRSSALSTKTTEVPYLQMWMNKHKGVIREAMCHIGSPLWLRETDYVLQVQQRLWQRLRTFSNETQHYGYAFVQGYRIDWPFRILKKKKDWRSSSIRWTDFQQRRCGWLAHVIAGFWRSARNRRYGLARDVLIKQFLVICKSSFL